VTRERPDWSDHTPRDPGGDLPPAVAAAIAPFARELARLRPGGELWDVHTHLGLDEDGRSMDLGTLLGILDQAGVHRACVFPLHDPERHPAYRVPNDRVLGWAGESEGRLVPFCRLDPTQDPVGEGERCLDRGARGIKLHPRAQAFAFDAPPTESIFALAAERGVPLLIHMGRGMPPLAEGLISLAERHPDVRLVLAHAAIHDQNRITHALRDHPGVHYDTSTLLAADVLELFARVPPERIVFGSDPPYGRSVTGLYLALRAARQAGCSPEQVAWISGGAAAALVDQAPLPPAGAPMAREVRPLPGVMLRIYGYLSLAVAGIFGDAPLLAAEQLTLAIVACEDPEAGPLADTLERLRAGLEAVRSLIEAEETRFFGIGVLHLCLTLAVTSVPDTASV
jgi:predicted TIM-barrel fold metal-dependent hydrolase